MKILCGGTPESYLYRLEILGNSTYKVVDNKLGFQKTAEFVIKHMDTNTAGRYQCRYMKQYSWSVHSEALELVVTGEAMSTVSDPQVFFLSYFFRDAIFRTVSDFQGNGGDTTESSNIPSTQL